MLDKAARRPGPRVSVGMRAWASRLQRLGWPVAEQFASPLVQLVITPVLLHRMETEQFALWVIAQSLVVAAPTLSLGRSSALLTVIPRMACHERDAQAAALVLRTLGLILIVTGSATLLMLLASTLAGRYWPAMAAGGSFLVLTIVFLGLTEAENTVSCGLKSYGLFNQTAQIELAGRAMQLGLVLSLIHPGAGVSELLVIAIGVGVLKLAAKLVALRRSGISWRGASLSAQSTRDARHIGFWSWMQVLSGVAFYSFDRWAVGAFMGSASLAAYSVCNQLAQFAHAVPAAASQTLIPWASAHSAESSPGARTEHLRQLAMVASVLACLPAVAVFAFAPQLLTLWISPAFSAEHSVLLRHLAFMFLILSLNIPSYSILIGLGKARWAAIVSLVAGVAYGAITLVLQPSSPVTMADLKLVYAAISLVLIAKLLHTLKRPTTA